MNERIHNETLLKGQTRVRVEGIHVYRVGDHDRVAAESPEDALDVMHDMSECNSDLTIDNVEELTPHQLDTRKYWLEGSPDGDCCSFRVQLYRLAGEGADFPRHFATTEI